MKKTALLLVVMLLMTSVVAFAGQAHKVITDADTGESKVLPSTQPERAWAKVTLEIKEGIVPDQISYSEYVSDGCAGILYRQITWVESGRTYARYEGWVHRGHQLDSLLMK